jgi:hypothetical protein
MSDPVGSLKAPQEKERTLPSVGKRPETERKGDVSRHLSATSHVGVGGWGLGVALSGLGYQEVEDAGSGGDATVLVDLEACS